MSVESDDMWLLPLASFIQHTVVKVHPHCGVCQSVPQSEG